MFRHVQTFITSLYDLTEQGYETLLRKPVFLLGHHGLKVGGMFLGLPRRQAVAIYAGLLWVIPGAMVMQFEPLYMVRLGLSETEVGSYRAFMNLVGLVGYFIGGSVADFWGRKRTIVLFDSLSWGGYCLSMGLASNKWSCVAALFFFAMVSASVPAYFGLLSEGISARKRATVFSVLQMVNQMPSALFLPLLGGLWVAKAGLVDSTRQMYWLFGGLVVLGVFSRWKFLPKSVTYEKAPVTLLHAVVDGIRQYRESLAKFFQHPAAGPLLASKFLDEWIINLWGMTYASLYYVNHLGVRDSNISIINQGSTYVSILLLFLLVPNFTHRFMVRILGGDQIFGLISILVLLFFGKGSDNPLLVCLLAAGLGAAGNSLYNSVNVSIWMNIVGEKERAKVVAASLALIRVGLVTTWFGALVFGKISPSALLWVMAGMRAINFFLLRQVAGFLNPAKK
ncbi:MAG TPA: MFS transporter [bacterium]|nr:MFS transporter [bacterium]